MLVCLFIGAAHGENLKIYAGIGNMLHGLRTISVSHAAAHDEQYRTLGIQSKLSARLCLLYVLIEFRMNRNAKRQQPLFRNAALYRSLGNQLARYDESIHVQHILPIRMDAIVGCDADARRCDHAALLHLADQMRREHVCAHNRIRLKIFHK